MLRQPLTFYTDPELVDWKKPCCKDECIYELHSPQDTMLPFVIKRISSTELVTQFIVQCFDGSNQTVLDPTKVVIACTTIEDGVKYDYLVYDGQDLGILMQCGHNQAVVFAGTEVYYSELFYVGEWERDTSPFIRVDYISDCPVKGIPYGDMPTFNFQFYLNPDAKWGLPQVSEDILSESDNFGREFQTGIKFSTQYLLQTGAIPFYLVGAWLCALMHKTVTLTEPMEGTVSTLLEIELSHTPDDNGCTHEVDLNFKLEDDLVKGACCDEVEKIECISEESVINVVSTAAYFFKGQLEQLPPNDGDCYYIALFSLGCPSNDWCDHLGEVACWNTSTGTWSYTELVESQVIWNIALGAFFMKQGAGIVEIPLITFTSVTGLPITSVDVEATIHPCYFGLLEFSYDGGGTYTEVAGRFTDVELLAGVTVAPRALNPTHIRLTMYNYNCPDIIGNIVAL